MPETSYSRIRLARRCMKAYDYKYNQRLARKKIAPPLLRGTILHEMIEARVYKKDPYEVTRKYEKKYRALFRGEQEMYGEDFIEDIDRIFAGYERAYASEPLEYEGSEVFVATNLTPEIRFVGYIDKLAKDREGRRWLMDHKSRRYIPDEDERFSDLQLVLYVWAWNREFPQRAIDGIMWDYLRTKPPTIPDVLKNGQLTQRKNLDTDYQTYVTELRRHQLDPRLYTETLARLKQRGSSYFYERIRLPNPSKSMIESVVEDARQTAVLVNRLGTSVTARNMTRDCKRCDFFQLCQAELRGLDADYVRKAEYEEREPNDSEEDED